MSTLTNTTAVTAAKAAAQAALAALPSPAPLALGAPVAEASAIVLDGQAVTAKFSGGVNGEIVVVVGQDLADALAASPLGELDLAKAIAPAIDAAAATLGPVVVDPGQVAESTAALAALAGKGEAIFVPLTDGATTRAVVAILASPWPAAPAATASDAKPFTPPAVSSRSGLDLLHDVEMEVTAELGRTRMSVRELLALAPGAVVELDRAAGAPTDLLVNGRLIARGEVVVVDENFGIRITEIVSQAAERA